MHSLPMGQADPVERSVKLYVCEITKLQEIPKIIINDLYGRFTFQDIQRVIGTRLN